MNTKVIISSIVLILLSIFIADFRSKSVDITFIPKTITNNNIVQVHIQKKIKAGDFSISLSVPSKRYTPNILNENFNSEGYGIASFYKKDLRHLNWTGKVSSGKTLNFYYTTTIKNGLKNLYDSPSLNNFYYKSAFSKKDEKLAENFMLSLIHLKPKKIVDKVKLCVLYPNCETGEFLARFSYSQKIQTFIIRHLLELAHIKAVVASGFDLSENSNSLSYFVRARLNNQWVNILPNNSNEEKYIFWNYVHDSKPKDNVSLNYTVSNGEVSLNETKITTKENKSYFRIFSLKYLPLSHQLSFKLLLLFPLGALIVCILRNIIGLQTFGTFLPVLTAVSYRDMGLTWGIILLSVLILTGILVRSLLTKLRLLMVPRVSATLTIVILILLTFTLLSNSLNFYPGLSIRFFPIVIITLLIERISVSVDEIGYIKSFSLYLTTLLVSVLAYLVLSSAYIQYLLFNFPELILAILGLIILIGRYTGIRLLEIYRFRNFLKENK